MSAVLNDASRPAAADTASPGEPATPPPKDVPRATFDDMGLRVGDRMQVAPPARFRGEPCMVRLIGYVRDLSLLVSAPPPGCWQAPVIEGDNVVMRVFSGRSAFGFACQVDKIIKLPFEYLHLSFPRAISSRVIRRSRRVKCSLPVTVDGGGLAATITNLSSTGAEIRTDEALGEAGKTVGLAFTIKVHDAETPVLLKAVVRSTRAVTVEGKDAWRSGVEFVDVPPAAGTSLKNLVYQELIERPQSIL